jgi:hypothetical protein
LCSDHEERIGQVIRFLANRHLAFLHGLQQRGLSLGRRAVDFVGEQDVCKHRAIDEAKLALALIVFIEDRRAGDVRRHQVGRELDPLKADVENLCDRRNHQRLRQTGNADEQHVAARKDRCHDLLDHFRLTDDHLTQLLDHLAARLSELGEIIPDLFSLHG